MFPGSALLGAWRTDSLVLLDTRRNSSKINSNVVGDQPEERERERERMKIYLREISHIPMNANRSRLTIAHG